MRAPSRAWVGTASAAYGKVARCAEMWSLRSQVVICRVSPLWAGSQLVGVHARPILDLRCPVGCDQPHPIPRRPVLSDDACRVLQDFWLELRQSRATSDGIPVTMRQLDGLVRLAEARARMELAEVVTAEHAADVVDVVRSSAISGAAEASPDAPVGAALCGGRACHVTRVGAWDCSGCNRECGVALQWHRRSLCCLGFVSARSARCRDPRRPASVGVAVRQRRCSGSWKALPRRAGGSGRTFSTCQVSC